MSQDQAGARRSARHTVASPTSNSMAIARIVKRIAFVGTVMGRLSTHHLHTSISTDLVAELGGDRSSVASDPAAFSNEPLTRVPPRAKRAAREAADAQILTLRSAQMALSGSPVTRRNPRACRGRAEAGWARIGLPG